MTIYDINDRLDTIVQQLGDCVLFTQEKKIDKIVALNLLSDLTNLSVAIQEEIQYKEQLQEDRKAGKAQEIDIDAYIEEDDYSSNMPCDNTGYCSNTCPMYYQCNT